MKNVIICFYGDDFFVECSGVATIGWVNQFMDLATGRPLARTLRGLVKLCPFPSLHWLLYLLLSSNVLSTSMKSKY